ncbi:small ribosomal subunit protein bS1m [Anabrus simplex]|uniref:small ribosomal subunit protein bS1m n=1 Tax=Anabrus simplex TaxID=316456 RepID=UPI0035A2CE98
MAGVNRCSRCFKFCGITYLSHVKQSQRNAACNILNRNMTSRPDDTTNSPEDTLSNLPDRKMGGFAKAFQKFQKYTDPPEPTGTSEPPKTFASLLKNSKFIDLGDPQGKIVYGKIFHVVNDDLYIDFGWKFHCVCQRPARNGSEYVRGAKVKLRINDLELSSKFLGSSKDLTLLEADCTLLGLVYSPTRIQQSS